MGGCTSSPGASATSPPKSIQHSTGRFRAAIENGDAKRRVAVHASKQPNRFNKETECCERLLPTDGGPPAPKAKVDPAVVAKAVEGIALFQGINPHDSSVLFDSMYEFEFAPGEYIMKKGEEGRNLYVVVSGHPVVTVGGKDGKSTVERPLKAGDLFGEVALLADCPRTASVNAGDTKVVCWALGRTTFRQVLSDSAFKRRARFGELLNKVELLSGLSDYARLQLADAVVATGYTRGQQILTQGKSEGVRFHIIERGQVQVNISGQESTKTLGPGAYFGELCLLDGQAPTATVVALGEVTGPLVGSSGGGRCSLWVEPGSDVITISLDKDGFKRMLGDETVTRIIQNNLKGYVFTEGTHPTKGSKKKKVPPSKEASSEAAAGSNSGRDGVTGKIGRMMRRMSVTGHQPRMHLEGLTPHDVVLLKEIGSGMTAFAYVSKVKTKAHGNIVAVSKVMNKYNLCRLGQVENVLREKQLLKEFDSSFIVHSIATFQDKTNLYLLMEYMVGGDMFQLLQLWGHISLAPCRFYAAEVLLALEYIHGRGYVYRDLKPENILIGDTGHTKIADLGFCKKVARGDRTYTTCGTPDYMAPEVMLCQGYNKSADYWAFGVLVYEMLVGYAPFASDSDRDRHNRILRATIKYPESFPAQGKDLVSKLCVLDISRRLGMMAGGIAEIQNHMFFAELKWSDVRNLNVKPPWTPRNRTLADLEKYHASLPQNQKVLQKDDQILFEGY